MATVAGNAEQVIIKRPPSYEDAQRFFLEAEKFRELMMMYSCAIREVRTKLEVLNDELTLTQKRNPIESISTRIKEPRSIVQKLIRKGSEVTIEAVQREVKDVAGVRVICMFTDDIYKIADMLTMQDDIRVVSTKDYIKNPKKSGYRSYHMIVEIPVFFSDRKVHMMVEIQIRTIAMDFWASLEHEMKYKHEIPNSEQVSAQLRQCSYDIADVERRMLEIRNSLPDDDEEEQYLV